MRRKLAYLLAGGALVGLLQWAVPAAYSAVAGEEQAAKQCPVSTECPVSKECPADEAKS